MGWWKVEGTQNLIGHGPLDTLGLAVREIVLTYEAAFKRRPTHAEWEALLTGVLGAEGPEVRVLDEGVVKSVRIDTAS